MQIAKSHQGQESTGNFSCLARILEKQRAERKAQILAQTERMCAAEQALTDSVRMRLGLSVLRDHHPLPEPPAGPRERSETSAQGGRIGHVKNLLPLNAEIVPEDETFRTQRHQRSLETQDEEVAEKFSGINQSSRLIHLPQTLEACTGDMTHVIPAPPPTPSTPKTPVPPIKMVACHERSQLPAETVIKGKETDTISELGLLYPDIEKEWRRMLWDKERKQRDKEERQRLVQLQKWNQLPNGRSTTAELRPTAYIPYTNLLPLPQPYGAQRPFKPSQLGTNMRHIRKPKLKPIEDCDVDKSKSGR